MILTVLIRGTVAESEEDCADPLYLELRGTLPALFSRLSCIQKIKFLLSALGPNLQPCLLATVSTTLPFKIGDPLRRIALLLAMLAVPGQRLSSQRLTGLEIFAQVQVPLFPATFVGSQTHSHDLVGSTVDRSACLTAQMILSRLARKNLFLIARCNP